MEGRRREVETTPPASYHLFVRRARVLISASLLFAAALLSATALPTPAALAAVASPTLAAVSGDVRVTQPGSRGPALAGLLLVRTALIQTGADGAAEIAFADGSKVQVGPGATLRIADLTDRRILLDLRDGYARSLVERARGRSFEIRTPTLTAGVRGTDFGVEQKGDTAQVDVFEGRVEATRGSERASVGAGQSAVAAPGQALQSAAITQARREAWNTRMRHLRSVLRGVPIAPLPAGPSGGGAAAPSGDRSTSSPSPSPAPPGR